MTRITSAIAPALLLVLVAAGCSAQPAPDTGSWTVMTYSIADTDLEPYMMADLEEQGEVGSRDGLNLIAFVDRAADYSDEGVLGLDDWQGGKVLEIGEGSATELDDLGDVNTGDPAVLADFISTTIADYPADHYSLIISDHGASWPGVGGDESSDEDTLSLDEINSGIADGLSSAGIDRLDLLGFDACLMATYEVASTLAPLADRLVASQELEPGHGWDYSVLSALSDGATTVDGLASAIIDGFEAQAKSEETEDSITLSEIDLTKMGAVDDALRAFTNVLIDHGASVAPTVGRSLASTLGFGTSPDPDQDSFMSDLEILSSQIGVDALFASDTADDLTRAINDAVLDRVEGQATQGATGMSIYFPPTAEYYNADYDMLDNGSGWSDFLAMYYQAGSEIPEAEQPKLDPNAQITLDDDGLTIVGTFATDTIANASEAYIRYGIVEDDQSISFLGEEGAYLSEDGPATATGVFDLTYLELSDGEDSATAYLSLLQDDDAGVLWSDVPLSYYSADGDEAGSLLLDLVFDPDTFEVSSSTYYLLNEKLGTYGQFTPKPDWIIVPQVLNVLDDGTEEWQQTSDVGLFADPANLTYSFPSLASGTRLYIELVVADFGGNTSTTSAIVTVP